MLVKRPDFAPFHSLFYSLKLFCPVFDRPPCIMCSDRLKSALWYWRSQKWKISIFPLMWKQKFWIMLVLCVDLYGTWMTGGLMSYWAAGLYAACVALVCVCSALGWIVCCVPRSISFPHHLQQTSAECTSSGLSWDITVFTTQTKCIHDEIHKKKKREQLYFLIFFPLLSFLILQLYELGDASAATLH